MGVASVAKAFLSSTAASNFLRLLGWREAGTRSARGAPEAELVGSDPISFTHAPHLKLGRGGDRDNLGTGWCVPTLLAM